MLSDAKLVWMAKRSDILDPGWRERHPGVARIAADAEERVNKQGAEDASAGVGA